MISRAASFTNIAERKRFVNNKMIPEQDPGPFSAENYLSNSTAFVLYNKLMATKTHGGPLPTYQREYIVQLLALGNTKPEIIKKFEERYHRRINPSTIIRLKKQQSVAIGEAHDVLATRSEIIGAAALKQKTHRLINTRLDRAIEDESVIDKLRNQLAAGEITRDEFDRDAARYEVLTINELTKLSDAMHNQAKNSDEDPALTPQDQAALQLLMQGINSGNPLQLIQVLNPKVYPNGENPAPQADSNPS